jgi:hypothetical protein
VHCIDDRRRRIALLALGGAVAGGWVGCASPPAPAPAPAPVVRAPAPAPVAPAPAPAPAVRGARSWEEFRLEAARKLVAANPDRTYMGRPPEPLLAIPVLEIELNGDGTVRSMKVMRPPRQAADTVQLAMDAVRRVGSFGPVAHLPRPWTWTEVFLFDDNRRFKPRTLD